MGKSQKSKKIGSKKIPEQIERKNKTLLFVFGGLTFILSFAGYLFTLAPSVTFEDSGELIVAAHRLGVPHEPGYPLFTMIGWLFSWLPVGNVAYRLNLMSAFFSALAAALVYFSSVHLAEDTFAVKTGKKPSQRISPLLKYLSGFIAGLLFAFSFENWEQSIITEVYGLHGFFTALFILLVILLKRSDFEPVKKKLIYLVSFITGLALTNHSTALLFIPVFVIFILILDPKLFLNLKLIGKSLLSGLVGLIPLLYLPIASSFDPVLDWGNPENFTNFIRTVSRHQYTELAQTSEKFSAGIHYYFTNLLPQQWIPWLLLLLIPALIYLFRQNRSMFWFGALFLVFYIPVTTYLTDFEVTGKGFNADLSRMLVTVFYIPSYLYLSILMGFGLYSLFRIVQNKIAHYAMTGVVLLLTVLTFAGNYKQVDMHDYRYPEYYLDNLFEIADDEALVFTQIDFFYFPTLYYQYIEGKGKNVQVVDQPLLKRSWYIKMLRNNYPSLIEGSESKVEKFLGAVEPFENGEPYNGNFIETQYQGMINAFIDDAMRAGKQVFFTFVPPAKNLRDYTFEPMLGAYRLTEKPELTKVDYNRFHFEDFKYMDRNSPFLPRTFSQYYGELHISRGVLSEQTGHPAEALNLYRSGLEFYLEDKRIRDYAKGRIKALTPTTK